MGKGDTIGSHGYFLLSFVKRAAGTMRGDNARRAPRERERRKWLSVSRGARPLVTLHDPVVLLCPAAGINVVISLYLRLFRRLLSSYHLVVYLLLSSIQLGLASLLPRGSSLLCYHDIDIVLSQNY
ncbi:hypothetical protein MOUN0_J01750 [Monosporozyma unispora]